MTTIYDFIKAQEEKYGKDIQLEEGWNWGMKEHLRKSFLYKNSQFLEQNSNRELRPNKNIVLGILNVQYRTEGFDVKDIELFVDDPDEYYKSFLVKKFHEKWALDNEIDTFIDELVESYCDYGGTLVKNVDEVRPEVVDLRTLAFCNQTNLLAYPFAFKYEYSQSDLRATKKQGWGDEANGATMSIEDLIIMNKKEDDDKIEVFEMYGILPKEYMQESYQEIDLENEDEMQFQVVAFYKDIDNNKQGVTLYRTRIPDLDKIFKLLKRDDIKGRALGRGGVEELFEPQKWTNWNEIKITEMLEGASKIVGLTDSTSVAKKHKKGLKDLDNWSLIDVGNSPSGKGIWQMDTFPRSAEKFNDDIERWGDHGEKLGGATDLLQGESPPAGTPFKSVERQTIEGKGQHDYRRGKIAVFVDEIYRDWILPYIQREIVKDNTFLSELSADEMLEVSKSVVKHSINRVLVEKVLNGESIKEEEKEALRMRAEDDFFSSNKKFIKIFKDEFKKKPLGVRTNIAGKQKNLAMMTDKVVGVLKQWMEMRANGVDTRGLDNLLNTILESSGLSPIMFGYPGQNQNEANTQGQPQAVGREQNNARSPGIALQAGGGQGQATA